MTQTQLIRAVSRATGEDFELIERRGFSLVDDEDLMQDDELEALTIDWDQVQADQATALFLDRQAPQAA